MNLMIAVNLRIASKKVCFICRGSFLFFHFSSMSTADQSKTVALNLNTSKLAVQPFEYAFAFKNVSIASEY